MQRFALGFYSVLMWLATPLLLHKLRRRARAEPGYGMMVQERFGWYGVTAPPSPAPSGHPLSSAGEGQSLLPSLQGGERQGEMAPPPTLWLHAVSLGETRAAAILLKELRTLLPHMRLLLTHGTATGRAEGAKLLQTGDVQVWQPWDTPAAVRRFLCHWQPRIGILLETEVWPNLVAGCRARAVPLVLANARLNAKSHAAALRLLWLSRPAYGGLAAVWAQTIKDADRLRDVGAQVSDIFGNLKFDVEPDTAQQAQGRNWRASCKRSVVLFASSREGEEAMWLQAVVQLGLLTSSTSEREAGGEEQKSVQWLIVPRHPQRVDDVQRLCETAGLSVSRRSQWLGTPETADIWLGDSMGEMALYYSMAHVTLLGGSFAPFGGQNLIEAIACHCSVIMGPHTFNFAQVAEMAKHAKLAQRVPDMTAAIKLACTLTETTQGHAQWAARCSAFMAGHRGAARATAAAIVGLL